MYDALVIGGGIIGMATAYHLVAGGARTLVIDRADYGRATDAAAGILAPVFNGLDGSPSWQDLMFAAVSYYPQLLAQLDSDVRYAQCGALLVAVSSQEALTFDTLRARIQAFQEHRQIPPADLHEITPQTAREMFPHLGEVRAAYYDRLGARVDGRALTQALHQAAEQRGLVTIQASVEKLIRQEQTITGVLAGGDMYTARKIVIAGGAWSRLFGKQLSVTLPLEPQRGQVIHLQTQAGDHNDLPLALAVNGHYIVPWPGGRFVVGATHESNAGFNAYTTASGIHEVLTEALRIAPGLRDAQMHEARVGLRPVTHDGMPVLGTVPGVDNVYLVVGPGAYGIQLGPFSGKLAADWALGHTAAFDTAAFSVSRFMN